MARSAQEVIEDALHENESWEMMLYLMTACIGVIGLAGIASAVARGYIEAAAIGSGGCGGIFYFALREARSIRLANIRIRLMEAPLAKAKSAKEAADIIRQAIEGWKPNNEPK